MAQLDAAIHGRRGSGRLFDRRTSDNRANDWQCLAGGKCAEANDRRGCLTGDRCVARGFAVCRSQASCVTVRGGRRIGCTVPECGTRGCRGCACVAEGHLS
jgi:hypothetical protein